MTETGVERSLPLSPEEADILVRLLSDELGREWRYERQPHDDVLRLHAKIAEFRSGWSEAAAG
jgi:hypothetical protein